jgi:hypothetical protein
VGLETTNIEETISKVCHEIAIRTQQYSRKLSQVEKGEIIFRHVSEDNFDAVRAGIERSIPLCDTEVLVQEGIEPSKREIQYLRLMYKLEQDGFAGQSFAFLDKIINQRLSPASSGPSIITETYPDFSDEAFNGLMTVQSIIGYPLPKDEAENLMTLNGTDWITEAYRLWKTYNRRSYHDVMDKKLW